MSGIAVKRERRLARSHLFHAIAKAEPQRAFAGIARFLSAGVVDEINLWEKYPQVKQRTLLTWVNFPRI
ncbi:hypothetical protein [Mesorhizobium comanense]|uniref:hypothetical protein n=1 Tax=Mesorhizobium comanense TaxID=2502215 RepID=UPI0010FA35F9|nr:hypothetical protein [Mesorhizobium comanense]